MSVLADDIIGLYVRGLTSPRAAPDDPLQPIVYTTRPISTAQRDSLATLLAGAGGSDLIVRPCVDGAPATLAQQIRFLDGWGTEAGLTVSLVTSRDALEILHVPREPVDIGGVVRLTSYLSSTETSAVFSSDGLTTGDYVWIGDECVRIASGVTQTIPQKGWRYSIERGRIGTRTVAHQVTDPPLLRLGLTDTMGAPAWLLRWSGDSVEILSSSLVTGLSVQGAGLAVSLSSQLAAIVDQTIRSPDMEPLREIEELALVWSPQRQEFRRASPYITVTGPSGLFVAGLPRLLLSVDQHGRGTYTHAWVEAGDWQLLIRIDAVSAADPATYRPIGGLVEQEVRGYDPIQTQITIERGDGTSDVVKSGLVRVLAVARDGAVVPGIGVDGSIPPELAEALGPVDGDARAYVRAAVAAIADGDPLGRISRRIYQGSDVRTLLLRDPDVYATWYYGARAIGASYPDVAIALLSADPDQSPDEALSIEDVDSAEFFEARRVVRGIDVGTDGAVLALSPIVTPPYSSRARVLVEDEALDPGFAFAAPTRTGGVRIVSWYAVPLSGATSVGPRDVATTTDQTGVVRDSAITSIRWEGPRGTVTLTSVPGRDRYRAGRSIEIETGWSLAEPSSAALSVLTQYLSAARTVQLTVRGTVTLDVGQLVLLTHPAVPATNGTRGVTDAVSVVLQVGVELASRAQVVRLLVFDSTRLRGWAPSALLAEPAESDRIALAPAQPQWGPTSWIRSGLRVQVLDAVTSAPGDVLVVSTIHANGEITTSPTHESEPGEILVLAGQVEQTSDAIERIRYAYVDGSGISPAEWQ